MAGIAPPPFGGPVSAGILPGLYVAVLGADKIVRIAHANNVEREWTMLAPSPVELNSSPALVSFSNALFVFALGVDRKVYYNVQASNGSWGGWAAIPDGEAQDQPAAVVLNNTLYLFIRGTNDHMYFKTLTQGWSGWQEVPGGGLTSSGLAATVVQDRELHLFIRGTNNHVYTNVFVGGSSPPHWAELPNGALISATPGAVAIGRSVFVVVRGMGDHIHTHFRNPAGNFVTSTAWGELPGGGFTHHNPVAALHDSDVHVYVRGTNGQLFRNVVTLTIAHPNDWSGWVPLPTAGSLAFAPATCVV